MLATEEICIPVAMDDLYDWEVNTLVDVALKMFGAAYTVTVTEVEFET
jgi:hypothetical protein